jgi:FkbM family methyltransferase
MCVSDPMLRTVGPGEHAFLNRLTGLRDLTVFDVGAHTGEYSSLLIDLCPTAHVFAFEPHPATFKQLQSVAADRHFTAVNMGLSDQDGEVSLYDYATDKMDSGSPHASLHREVIEDLHHSSSIAIPVRVTTVDVAMRSHQISHLNLLKLDTEGHELQVLNGASEALRAQRIDIIQFEVNEMNVISRVFFRDFYDALPGFAFYRLVSDGLAPVGEYRARTHELFFLHNVVAIRRSLPYAGVLIR